jgi:hypothetical protein
VCNISGMTKKTAAEKPCRSYLKGDSCEDGRDHCFNCGRHLDPETASCPKNCGQSEVVNDAANNEED